MISERIFAKYSLIDLMKTLKNLKIICPIKSKWPDWELIEEYVTKYGKYPHPSVKNFSSDSSTDYN